MICLSNLKVNPYATGQIVFGVLLGVAVVLFTTLLIMVLVAPKLFKLERMPKGSATAAAPAQPSQVQMAEDPKPEVQAEDMTPIKNDDEVAGQQE